MSIAAGNDVLVKWADGNKYPGKVVQAAPGQSLVEFSNGNQQWIAEQYLEDPAAAAPPAPPSQQQEIGALQVDGDALQIKGGGGIKVYEGVEDEWNELQAVIARVEGEGLSLGAIDAADPISYWRVMFAIEESEGQGVPRDQAIQQQGYMDADHWDLVSAYVGAKWSYVGTDEDGQQAVLQKNAFMNGALQARQGQMAGQQDAAAAADPSLLAPVNGVDIDTWAAVSAGMGSLGAQATQQDVDQYLAQHGVDRATWDAANAGWQAKMQGDTSFVIATKYGEAFGVAQNAGGGAAAAGGAGTGGGRRGHRRRAVQLRVLRGDHGRPGVLVRAGLRRQRQAARGLRHRRHDLQPVQPVLVAEDGHRHGPDAALLRAGRPVPPEVRRRRHGRRPQPVTRWGAQR